MPVTVGPGAAWFSIQALVSWEGLMEKEGRRLSTLPCPGWISAGSGPVLWAAPLGGWQGIPG